MKLHIALLTTILSIPLAMADVYKSIDSYGNVTYSNKPISGGKKIDLPAISTINSSMPDKVPSSLKSDNPGSVPSVNLSPASGSKKVILEEELKKEQEALALAEAEYKKADAVRNGDEKNYAKKMERLQPFLDSITQHKNNIKSLEIELNGSK